jgi:hypothetical protein
VPGVVCVLYLYGKELNLGPHVHVLLTEGGLTKGGEWGSVSFLEWCFEVYLAVSVVNDG